MLSDEERLRVYGSAEAVAAADRYINDLADSAPPLTPRQKDRLRALFRPAADAPVIPRQLPRRAGQRTAAREAA